MLTSCNISRTYAKVARYTPRYFMSFVINNLAYKMTLHPSSVNKNVSYLLISGLSNIKLHLNVHLLRNTQQSSGDTKRKSNYLVDYPIVVGEVKIMNRG